MAPVKSMLDYWPMSALGGQLHSAHDSAENASWATVGLPYGFKRSIARLLNCVS